MTRATPSADWSDFAVELGWQLQVARMNANLSQERVAHEAGVSRYTYQKLERGIARPGAPANPTLRTLLAVCQVIGVNPSDVLPSTTPDLRTR